MQIEFVFEDDSVRNGVIIPVTYGHISHSTTRLKVVSENADSLRVSGLEILHLEAADPLAVAMPGILAQRRP